MILNLLSNSKIVFPIAILCAFIFPQPIEQFGLAGWILPLLIGIMIVSLKDFSLQKPTYHELTVSIGLFFTNYIVLSGLYIASAFLLVSDPFHRGGLILIGLMPPAINIVSFTVLLKGNLNESIYAELIGFIIALLAVPFLSSLLLKESVDSARFIKLLFYSLVIPLIAGPILGWIERKIFGKPLSIKKMIVTLGNGFLFYIMIGMNRDILLNFSFSTFKIILILLVIKIVFLLLIYHALRCRIPHDESIDYVLFGSFKMIGVAAAAASQLLGPQATLPVAVDSILFLFQIILVEYLLNKSAFMKVCKRIMLH